MNREGPIAETDYDDGDNEHEMNGITTGKKARSRR